MPGLSDTPMSSPTPVHATIPILTILNTSPPPIITGYPPGTRTLTFAPPSTHPLPWPQLPNYPRILSTTPSNLAGIESLSLPTLTIADTIATMLYNHSPASLAQFFGPLCSEAGPADDAADDTTVTFVREEVEETSEEEEERGYEALVPRGCLLVSRRGREVLAGPFQHTSGGALFPVQVVYAIKSTGEWAPRLVRFDTHCEELWGVYEPWSKGAVRHVSGDEGEVRECGERLAKEWLAMRKWEGTEEVLDEDGERICVGVKVQLRMEVGEMNVDWLL